MCKSPEIYINMNHSRHIHNICDYCWPPPPRPSAWLRAILPQTARGTWLGGSCPETSMVNG